MVYSSVFIRLSHNYAVLSGRHVRTGMRQSMPSSNIDNWAAVTLTLPSRAAGQTNRPFSRRLEKRQAPGCPTK